MITPRNDTIMNLSLWGMEWKPTVTRNKVTNQFCQLEQKSRYGQELAKCDNTNQMQMASDRKYLNICLARVSWPVKPGQSDQCFITNTGTAVGSTFRDHWGQNSWFKVSWPIQPEQLDERFMTDTVITVGSKFHGWYSHNSWINVSWPIQPEQLDERFMADTARAVGPMFYDQ